MASDPSASEIASAPFKGRLGFGEKAALVLVDFTLAYVTPGSALYCGHPEVGVVPAVKQTEELLALCRQKGLPVIYTRVLYDPNFGGKDGGVFIQKVPFLSTWIEGNKMCDIVPELPVQPGDHVLVKQYPSAFFGTSLASMLTALRVDTIILTGCSTSGCIRATATDAMQNGFRVVVPRQCVGDRTPEVHEANLFDINAKVGDVMDRSEVLLHLSSLADSSEPAAKKQAASKRQKTSPVELNDGVTDFKKGQRDFTAAKGQESKALCADFVNETKEYTNGVVAKNTWRSHAGPLTGELVRIPDVNSGYPKSVFPAKWEEGAALPTKYEAFEIGNGFPDQNEFRMKFGVIIPSTNTTVEYDFWSMIMGQNKEVCKGIGFHVSGILIDNPKLATDEDMLNFLTMFRKQLLSTVDRLMTAEPQYIIMGMSLETFFGGWEGNKEFKAELTERTGLNIATGAEACKASLEKFGAKRITIITPYQEIGDKNVVKFFTEIGFEVVRIAGLKCGSATDIAHVPEAWCEKVIRENLVLPGIDAIVQCGTNLAMVPLADRLERELGIPIIAINVACLWFGMREAGIDAKLQGCTRLFREH